MRARSAVGHAVAEHVHLAALELEQGGGRAERKLVVDRVEVRLALLPVLRVAGEHDLAARRPLLEDERAGAQRVTVELLAPLLDPLLGHDVTEVHGDGVEEGEVRVLERDLDGVVVDGLEAGDLSGLALHELVGADDAHVEGRGRRARLEHHALEAVLEVGRRHLTIDRRLELDALAQVEGVRLAVGRDAAVGGAGHLGRQARDELGAGLAGLVRVLQEALVDVVLDLPVDDVPGDRRVEARRLREVRQGERAALPGLVRGRGGAAATSAAGRGAARGESERQHQDESQHRDGREDTSADRTTSHSCLLGRAPSSVCRGHRLRCCGSKASRNPSPTRLNASTVIMIASPG